MGAEGLNVFYKANVSGFPVQLAGYKPVQQFNIFSLL